MNRHFFADDDPEGTKSRMHEVEVIRNLLKDTFKTNASRFRLFLDIHAHSAQSGIFIYSP